MIASESDPSNDRMTNADLHCHTLASDGTLTPEKLMERAIANNLEILAITDHDTIDGYLSVKDMAAPFKLVSGVEFSTQWRGMGIHIVGLDFQAEEITSAVQHQIDVRVQRSEKIASRLEKKFKRPIYEGVKQLAGNGVITRPHFAEYLVQEGLYSSVAEAFKKFLGTGKPGDVKSGWPEIAQAVDWITKAGGFAVLAHPHKYKLTNRKLGMLLDEFKAVGGQGFELSVTGINPNVRHYYTELCQKYDFIGSRASDFHGPGHHWCELGKVPPIPAGVTPIWQAFK